MIKNIGQLFYKVIPKGKKTYTGMFIEKKFIKSLLPKNPVIVDCGAHYGLDTIELAAFENSSVYAFEPIKEVYKLLLENTNHWPNINCFNMALSDFNGTATMYKSSGGSDGSSSLLKPKIHLIDHPDVLFDQTEDVVVKTLDNWADETEVKHVDMLWLDMQGAEQAMLMKSNKILSTVRIIHTEVSTKETYEGVQHYKNFRRFLKQKGFEPIVEAIPDGYDMGNVLFIRK